MLSINKLLLPVASALLVLGAFVASLADTLDDASPPDEVNSKALWTTGSISSHKGFQHYFRLEFELLTNQAMILGDYHPNDEESRLKLQLKALQIELAYTCCHAVQSDHATMQLYQRPALTTQGQCELCS